VGALAVLACQADACRKIAASLAGVDAGASLAQAEDFRFARQLGLKDRDGFLFISEAAVARLVSPRFWLATTRRADCLDAEAELEAAYLFGKKTGRDLPDIPTDARVAAVGHLWVEAGRECRGGGLLTRTPD